MSWPRSSLSSITVWRRRRQFATLVGMAQSETILPTTCWECSAHCGALVTVENGRVTKVAPNPEHPASLGAFCIKGIRGLPDMTYHADRVLYPLKRDRKSTRLNSSH